MRLQKGEPEVFEEKHELFLKTGHQLAFLERKAIIVS